MHAMPPNPPRVIYVKDFDLEPETFQAESGILPIRPTPAGAFILRLLGVPEESAVRERELVKLMSSALISDLAGAGLNAQFLRSDELFPSEGWLVRGAFLQVDEGNRLRRALLGLAAERQGSSSGLATSSIVPWDLFARWTPALTAAGNLGQHFHSIHMSEPHDLLSTGST